MASATLFATASKSPPPLTGTRIRASTEHKKLFSEEVDIDEHVGGCGGADWGRLYVMVHTRGGIVDRGGSHNRLARRPGNQQERWGVVHPFSHFSSTPPFQSERQLAANGHIRRVMSHLSKRAGGHTCYTSPPWRQKFPLRQRSPSVGGTRDAYPRGGTLASCFLPLVGCAASVTACARQRVATSNPFQPPPPSCNLVPISHPTITHIATDYASRSTKVEIVLYVRKRGAACVVDVVWIIHEVDITFYTPVSYSTAMVHDH